MPPLDLTPVPSLAPSPLFSDVDYQLIPCFSQISQIAIGLLASQCQSVAFVLHSSRQCLHNSRVDPIPYQMESCVQMASFVDRAWRVKVKKVDLLKLNHLVYQLLRDCVHWSGVEVGVDGSVSPRKQSHRRC